MMDSSTSPAYAAHRADAAAFTHLRTEQDAPRADVAGPLDARVGVHLAPGLDRHRAVARVDAHERMHLGPRRHVDLLARAEHHRRLVHLALDPVSAGGNEVRLQLVRVRQHDVPDVVEPRPAIVRALGLPRRRNQARIIADRGHVRGRTPDRQLVAVPLCDFRLRRFPLRSAHARVDEQHFLAAAAGQVVHGDAFAARRQRRGQVVARQQRRHGCAGRARDLGGQRGRPALQLKNAAHPDERQETAELVILEDHKLHTTLRSCQLSARRRVRPARQANASTPRGLAQNRWHTSAAPPTARSWVRTSPCTTFRSRLSQSSTMRRRIRWNSRRSGALSWNM